MKKQKKILNETTEVESATLVEGEGSYTATRRYNEGLKRSVDAGNSNKLAEDAKNALAGPEAPALERAEHLAKKGDPKVNRASKSQ